MSQPTSTRLQAPGQFIQRTAVSTLLFADTEVPIGAPLLVVGSWQGVTDLALPDGSYVSLFDHELDGPGFSPLDRTATDSERNTALRRLGKRPGAGKPLRPRPGQVFRRSGRPFSSATEHHAPYDETLMVIGTCGYSLGYEVVGESTLHNLPLRYFTNAYITLLSS